MEEIFEDSVVEPVEVAAEETPVVETVVEEEIAPVAPVAKKAAKKSSKKIEKPVGPVYIACRKLTVKGKIYRPGDVVPEANSWTRIETWVRTGYLKLEEH